MKIRNHYIKDAIIIKAVVMVGLIAYHFLPPEYAVHVALASNLLWLWRT